MTRTTKQARMSPRHVCGRPSV